MPSNTYSPTNLIQGDIVSVEGAQRAYVIGPTSEIQATTLLKVTTPSFQVRDETAAPAYARMLFGTGGIFTLEWDTDNNDGLEIADISAARGTPTTWIKARGACNLEIHPPATVGKTVKIYTGSSDIYTFKPAGLYLDTGTGEKKITHNIEKGNGTIGVGGSLAVTPTLGTLTADSVVMAIYRHNAIPNIIPLRVDIDTVMQGITIFGDAGEPCYYLIVY
jgi:hypothetical protein